MQTLTTHEHWVFATLSRHTELLWFRFSTLSDPPPPPREEQTPRAGGHVATPGRADSRAPDTRPAGAGDTPDGNRSNPGGRPATAHSAHAQRSRAEDTHPAAARPPAIAATRIRPPRPPPPPGRRPPALLSIH